MAQGGSSLNQQRVCCLTSAKIELRRLRQTLDLSTATRFLASVADLELWCTVHSTTRGITENQYSEFLCKATGKLYSCQATNIVKILVFLFHSAHNTL